MPKLLVELQTLILKDLQSKAHTEHLNIDTLLNKNNITQIKTPLKSKFQGCYFI